MNIAAYAGTTFTVIIIIFGFLIAGVATFLLMLFIMRELRYNTKCYIWQHVTNGGRPYVKHDRGGIFVDKKTGNKLFFLKKTKVGLSPDNVPYVNTFRGRIVYLLQFSLKDIRYFDPLISKNPGATLNVSEEDVNWAINSFSRSKALFATGKFMQLLPYIMIAFTGVIILAIFALFFKNIGVLKDVAIAFKEAAATFASTQGTTVITP